MVSGTTDRWLTSDVALPTLYRVMEPNLIMYDLIPFTKEKSNVFMYMRDETAAADPKREIPAPFIDSANLPELDFSRPTMLAETMASRGFSLRLSRQIIRDESKAVPELRRAYERAGRWMATALNAEMLAAFVGGAGCPLSAFNPTVPWSDPNFAPLEDLRHMSEDFDQDGYDYALTDAYVLKPCWDELNGYSFGLDVQGVTREMYGKPERPSRDTLRIPALELDVHKLKASSGFADGAILGIDADNPAAEFHYYVDEKYGSANVSYPTIENGSRVEKSVPNFGIHFEQIEEKEKPTHDTILRFWYEGRTMVRSPLAIAYGTGI